MKWIFALALMIAVAVPSATAEVSNAEFKRKLEFATVESIIEMAHHPLMVGLADNNEMMIGPVKLRDGNCGRSRADKTDRALKIGLAARAVVDAAATNDPMNIRAAAEGLHHVARGTSKAYSRCFRTRVELADLYVPIPIYSNTF